MNIWTYRQDCVGAYLTSLTCKGSQHISYFNVEEVFLGCHRCAKKFKELSMILIELKKRNSFESKVNVSNRLLG